MLSSDRKVHIRQHLVGNFLNKPPDTTKKRANEITKILNTTGFPPDKKIGMSAFIERQQKHFVDQNPVFSNEIKEFEQESEDLIATFNQEYLELMKDIATSNLPEDSIREQNRSFADKRREHKFA